MSSIKAVVVGLSRTLGAWRLVIGLWLLSVAVAAPFAAVMAKALHDAIGPSLVHEQLRRGFDLGWFGELEAEAEGLLATFTPTLVGPGAFFNNLEAWLSGELFSAAAAVVALGVGYALLFTVLTGGILERLAGPGRARGLSALLAASGRYCFRFVRLALLAGVLYYLIYRLQRWLFHWLEETTRDVTVERTVLAGALAVSAVTLLLLTLVHVVFDYAKIATVLESRRSMLLAALRGLRFVAAHPIKTLLLYTGIGALGVALLAGYALVAPGVEQGSVTTIAIAFLVSQAYLVLKLALRLGLLGGQLALFQDLERPKSN